MAGVFSPTGEFSYNTVTFPAHIQLSAHSDPVLDSTGRFTKYVAHTFRVETVFHDNQTTPAIATLDTDLPNIREKLSQVGGSLVVNTKGFGALSVNTTDQDVAYGPIPRVLAWESIGSNQAVRCVWSVTVHLKTECQFAAQLAELNYDIAWDIDESGLTRRNINGRMELPVRRTGNTPSSYTLTDTVDRYRDRFNAPLIPGFSRERQSWSVSADRRTATFNITDVEIPSDNPYYPGVIRPQVNGGFSNSGQILNPGTSHWSCSLSGNISVAMGVPKWFAWAAFLLVIRSRFAAAKLARTAEGETGGLVIIRSLSVTDEIFGRGMSFDIQWLMSSSLETIFRASGTWERIEGSWDGYNTFMGDVSGNWSNRGHAQMFHRANDDTLVQLCGPQQLTANNGARRVGTDIQHNLFQTECPSPEFSWINFQNSFELIHDPNVVVHNPLTQPEQLTTPNFGPAVSGSVITANQQTRQTITQRRTQSTFIVRMKGYAIRAGHKIPYPELQTYGGAPATLHRYRGVEPRFTHREIGDWGGCKVYVARWERYYTLDTFPVGDATVTKPDTRGFR